MEFAKAQLRRLRGWVQGLPGGVVLPITVIVALLLAGGGVAGSRAILRAATTTTSPTTPPATLTASPSANTLVPALTGASPTNLVQVLNQTNGRLRVEGRVQYNEIEASTVTPVNSAIAVGSTCTGCQTMAVALQINVLSTHANYVAPANTAVAANGACNGCVTIARAIEYNISVDDPHAVPPRVRQLVAAMKQALATLPTSASLADAENRVEIVISQFQDLAGWLIQQRQVATDPTTPNIGSVPVSPSPSPSPSASPTLTPAPSASPAPSPSPT